MCKDTSIDVNLVNHTRCQCGCNINLRSCKGKQVRYSISNKIGAWFIDQELSPRRGFETPIRHTLCAAALCQEQCYQLYIFLKILSARFLTKLKCYDSLNTLDLRFSRSKLSIWYNLHFTNLQIDYFVPWFIEIGFLWPVVKSKILKNGHYELGIYQFLKDWQNSKPQFVQNWPYQESW